MWFHTTGWGSLRRFCEVDVFVKLAGPADSDDIRLLWPNHFTYTSIVFFVIIISPPRLIACDLVLGVTLITITGTVFALYPVGISVMTGSRKRLVWQLISPLLHYGRT